jgi:hypothetical protein
MFFRVLFSEKHGLIVRLDSEKPCDKKDFSTDFTSMKMLNILVSTLSPSPWKRFEDFY